MYVVRTSVKTTYCQLSLVPRLPDLFNARQRKACIEKDQGAWGRGYCQLLMKLYNVMIFVYTLWALFMGN